MIAIPQRAWAIPEHDEAVAFNRTAGTGLEVDQHIQTCVVVGYLLAGASTRAANVREASLRAPEKDLVVLTADQGTSVSATRAHSAPVTPIMVGRNCLLHATR